MSNPETHAIIISKNDKILSKLGLRAYVLAFIRSKLIKMVDWGEENVEQEAS